MKNKKGFTLIELLAVIVVLAIILVIAGTNVIKYINSTKENAKFIAAKEIVNIAEAYMEANNLDVVTVRELMSDEVGYLEKDATNPSTGGNSWSSVEKNQFIIQEKTATAQSNSEIQNGTYYGFDGYYYVVDTSKIALNDVETAGEMTSCDGQKILINGNCVTINNNLADSDVPEEESSFEIKSCGEYQDIADKLYNASLTYFESNVVPIKISELINSNTNISNLKNPLKESGDWGTNDKVIKNAIWNKDNSKPACEELARYYRYNYTGYLIDIYYK